MNTNCPKSEAGISLVEVLLVISTIVLLVILLASFPNSMQLVQKSQHLGLAREIAAKKIEDIRSLQYINLTLGDEAISDPRLSLLPKGSGMVSVEDCSPSICTQSEDTKQVSVTISWKEAGKDQSVSMKTLVSEGGISK